MSGSCHAKDKERGAWFEIQCVKETIIAKEKDGKDASFERNLLKSWSKYPGYENATDALAEIGLATREKSKSGGIK